MGTTLTGTTPQDTYDSLIKVTDNGPIGTSLKTLTDGLGNDSALALSSRGLKVNQSATLITDAASLCHFSNNYLYIRGGSAGLSIGDDAFSNSITLADNADIAFEAGSAERMRIASNGNVTIKGPTASNGGVLNLENTTTAVNGSDWGSIKFISNDSSTSASGIRASIVGTSTSFNGDGNIVFSTAPSNGTNTERMRILSTGGITFNGDTLAANALDDYEEGTFTPFVYGSTTAGTADYVRSARYTKIGRQVSVQIDISWSSGTGSGLLIVGGLPLAEGQIATNPAVTIGFISGIALTASNFPLAYIANGQTFIEIVQYPVGGTTLSSVPYSAAGRIILNATYTA